eukprot:scaffold58700_cov22-Tisochrysis_lutea.AAC.1
MAKDFLLQVRDKANKCILDQVKVLLQVVDPKKTAVYVANVPALEDAPATLKDKRNYTDEAGTGSCTASSGSMLGLNNKPGHAVPQNEEFLSRKKANY